MQRIDVEKEQGKANPQEESSLKLTAAAAAAASVDLDSDNDSDSDLDSDDGGCLSYVTCVFELKIDIHPETFETIYSLRAVPYVQRGDNPFKHLDEDYQWASSWNKQALYKYFEVSGADAILERLKALRQNEYLKIGNDYYEIDCMGVIGGIYGRYYFPSYASEFKSEQFDAFLRCADLILSNKMMVDDAVVLNAEFTRQNNEYKLSGDAAVIKFKINKLQARHPIYVRNRDLRSYSEKKQTPASREQASSTYESMTSSAQRMLTSLYGELAHALGWTQNEVRQDLLIQPAPVLSMEAGVQERLAVIARLRQDQYPDIAAQKQDLKRLFKLRAYFEPTEAYYNSQAYFVHLQSAFWLKVDKPECWQDPVIIAQARKLLIESILVTDSILADMECFLRQAGEEPTADNVAALLANQQYDFCRTFIYTGVIDFYPAYREKACKQLIPGYFINYEPAYRYKLAERAETNELFFREGAQENHSRKLYNTFIKDGFNRYYGVEKPDGSNDFRAKLCDADNRFSNWSTQDSKVNTPVKETWGQFFQRKIKGGDAPVVEELTYRHPLGTARPT